MKKWWLALLFSQSLSVPALADTLPDGFDGLRWQAPVAQLPNAQKVKDTPYYQCFRSGDGSAMLNGAPVVNKRFCFANDRFYFVQMEFSGQPAYEKMLEYARAQWGDGRPTERFTETTLWGGREAPVYVELEFSKADQRGTLALVYLPIYRETQDASRQERARARPGAGF